MVLVVLVSGCCVAGSFAQTVAEVFHAGKLTEMDAAISLAISDGRLPGGVLWLERNGVAYRKTLGDRAIQPTREAMTEDTIFDAASLTKVIATTSAIMRLAEQKRLDLNAPVATYIPEFTGGGKEAVTVRQLLTHTSGLRPGIGVDPSWSGIEGAIRTACAERLQAPPDTVHRYSDINFILLREIASRAAGVPLNVYCEKEIFGPLGMKDTSYLPAESLRPRIAPTTELKGEYLRGVVHDPTARQMGGVAGHAGLFTTAADLARFSRMMLAGGELDGVRIFSADTVALMTHVQTGEQIAERRGLGWDIDTPYAGPRGNWFPIGSYGHTGWTGGSLWIDPFSRSFVIFLSNRNHPTEAGSVVPLRRLLGTLSAEAIHGFNFLHVPGALPWSRAGGSRNLPPPNPQQIARPVLNGIDVLARDGFKALQGMKIGLVTNHTGIDRERRSTIDLLHKAPGVQLVALFSPEHGIRGAADEKVSDSVDDKTKLPIYSLYGESRAPTAAQLEGIDALVFDIQDIGTRFYTYISTMGECLTATAALGKKLIVLDRPNPITGARVEGPMLASTRSFTAWHEIPVRHGMTVGELAKLFAAERAPQAQLTVVPCEGWTRDTWFDATAQPWLNPSPNMRSLHAATIYPGLGLLEFCNLSVGRGTDRPFEIFGAPYIDGDELAEVLNGAGLDGVRFIGTRYTPAASVFKGKECGGVQIVITDRDAFSPLDFGMVLATTLQRLHAKELKIENLSKLLAHPATLEAVRAGKPLSEIKTLWVEEREAFRARRSAHLLY
ncbi:MAG: exo-beta-N-acetylmuramidase NamZ domain-containing protein [Chthoniobacteraceae bacterium]